MQGFPQGQKRIKPYSFNQSEPIKVKLSWSNLKSDSSSIMENESNNKSSWSNLKSDTSCNIKNVSIAKFPWSTLNSHTLDNLKNQLNAKSNNTDSQLKENET